jgi:hypothetical protein
MKPMLTKGMFAVSAAMIAIVHYAIFSVSYVEAEVPAAGADPATSKVIKTILSFPLGYLASMRSVAAITRSKAQAQQTEGRSHCHGAGDEPAPDRTIGLSS